MKVKKIIKMILASTVGVIMAIVAAGNYFMDYSITRQSKSGDRVVDNQLIEDTESELQKTVRENQKKENELGQQWHERTPYEEVMIQTPDGLKLYGDFYPAKEENHKYLLAIHGYKVDKTAMYGYAAHYWEQGYHILTIDQRSHGKSEGKYIGMGWLERKDMLQWIDYLVEKDPNAQIVMHGVSMGAATVMMTAGEDLPVQVKACVEDCGFSSVWDIMSSELNARFHLPSFPLVHAASAISRLRAGYDFKEASSVEQLKKAKVPMLFIHGTKDGFVPFDMLQKVYDAHPGEKDIYVVEDVDHTDAVNADVEKYYDKVFSFLDRYMEKQQD